jgi:hypothetical protein
VNGIIDHVTATNNQYGIALNAVDASGGTANFTITNSIGSNNSNTGLYIQISSASSQTSTLTATVDMSTFNNNYYGIIASNNITLLLGRSVITSNAIGIFNASSSSTLYTYGDNRINQNGHDIYGSALSTTYKPQ